MKLEVGMYVRNNHFGIGKINKEYFDSNNKHWFNVQFNCYKDEDCHCGICEETMGFKARHNITDLIEAGDVITFKNDNDVYKVICIPNKKHACDCFYLEFNYADKYGVEDIYVSKEDMEETLKSIVTKEKFKSVEYEV